MTSLPSGSKEAPQTPSHWCLFGLASGVWGVPQRGPVLAVVLTQRGLGFRLDSCAVDPRRASSRDPELSYEATAGTTFLPKSVFTLRAALTRGGLFVGNRCFSSSGRHRPRGPTTRHQCISAVVCCAMWLLMCRNARKRESPLEGGLGGEP